MQSGVNGKGAQGGKSPSMGARPVGMLQTRNGDRARTQTSTASWLAAAPGTAVAGMSPGVMGRAALILAVLGASACTITKIGDGSGDSSGGPGGGDELTADAAPEPVDDSPDVPDAAVAADECYRSAIGALEMIDPVGYTSGSGVDAFFGLTAAIDDVPVGVFYLDLYGGFGSLPDGPVPGVYPIAGEDTDWSLCAICVWATFGVSPERWIMAQSGTVTIDQVGSRLVGSLANIQLVEIDELDQPIPGGCNATVPTADFDVLVE